MSWQHGTRYAYQKKRCRCWTCRDWSAGRTRAQDAGEVVERVAPPLPANWRETEPDFYWTEAGTVIRPGHHRKALSGSGGPRGGS